MSKSSGKKAKAKDPKKSTAAKPLKLGNKSQPFDKYALYKASVQMPQTDAEFLRDTYRQIQGKLPRVLREDFCGTHAICCEWVKLHSEFKALGVDLDPEPIKYGVEHYQPLLTDSQRSRLKVLNKNVLDENLPSADIIAAFNFSYYLFKTRLLLRSYFKNCLKSLNDSGLLIIDCFGGGGCMEANEEETEFEEDDFSYFWDQDSFDPVNNYAQFYIHFKRKGEKKREKIFSYDWRMWTIPELREVMLEAGFKKTTVYWEGTTKDGDGDGNFKPVEKGEDCESWVAYVVGEV